MCWCVLCSFVPLALRIVFRDSESSSLSIPSDVSHPTPALESETPPRSSLPATSYSRVVAGFQGSKGSTTGHVVSGRMRRHSIVSIQPSSRKKRKKKSFWLGVSARVRSRPRLPASAGRQSRDKTIRNTRNRISMSVDPFSTDSGSDGALGLTPLRARSATPSYAGSGGAPRTVPQSLVFSHSRASSECMGATLAGLVVMFVWA